jgi:hypothetical protein
MKPGKDIMPNELQLTPEWLARIAEEQHVTHETIEETRYKRLPYGNEYPHIAPEELKPQCRDCGCERGELHGTNCCVELCPKCRAQRISCSCGIAH